MTTETVTAVLLIVVPDRLQPRLLRARPGVRLPEHPAQGARRDPAALRGRRLRAHPALAGAPDQRARHAAAGGAAGRRRSARSPALTRPLGRRRGRRRARPGPRARALAVRRAGAGAPLRGGPDGPDGDATRRTVEIVFATLHRLLGVGIGEHLGYLFTGLWTLLVAGSILSTASCPAGSASSASPIGIALLIGTLEFVGPERARRLAAGRHDRADRVHRLVGLADRARRLPARLNRRDGLAVLGLA